MTLDAAHIKETSWKRLAQNVALSMGVSFLCVLGFELVLRLQGYGNQEIYEPDAHLFWKLAPNQNCCTKVGHKPVRINSHGTRGPEFEKSKPQDTLRILSLGDSRTFGWGLTEEETYSRQLEQLLRHSLGQGRRVEVINAGVNAWSFSQILVYLRDTGLEFQPDFIVLAEANPWTQFSPQSSPTFVKKIMRRVWLKSFLRRFAIYNYVIEFRLRRFYQWQRAKFLPIDPQQDKFFREQQRSNYDEIFRTAIEGTCKLALAHDIQPVLLYLPDLVPQGVTNASPMPRLKRQVADDLKIALVDLSEEFQRRKEFYLEGDPVHFNAAANEIIARRLFQSIDSLTR